MNVVMDLLARAYTLILYLYPDDFRLAFGDEMRRVYCDALEDAAQRGYWQLIGRFSLELRDLPRSLVRQYKERMNIPMGGQMEITRNNWLKRLFSGTIRFGEPGSWTDVFMGVLPHILFLVLGGIFTLLQSPDPFFMEQYAVASIRISEVAAGLLGIIILMVMIIAWRLGWPLWSASWYGYGIWGIMVAIALINQRIHLVVLHNILFPVALLSIIVGYLRLIRYDVRRGLLAIFFLAPNLILSFMEFIPDQVEARVYLITGVSVVLATGVVVRTRSLRWALATIAVVNVAASLMMAYVEEFFSDFPSTRWDTAPALTGWFGLTILYSLLMVGLVFGPLLLWHLWDFGKRTFSV